MTTPEEELRPPPWVADPDVTPEDRERQLLDELAVKEEQELWQAIDPSQPRLTTQHVTNVPASAPAKLSPRHQTIAEAILRANEVEADRKRNP